jgi:hypothetical protein
MLGYLVNVLLVTYLLGFGAYFFVRDDFQTTFTDTPFKSLEDTPIDEPVTTEKYTREVVYIPVEDKVSGGFEHLHGW